MQHHQGVACHVNCMVVTVVLDLPLVGMMRPLRFCSGPSVCMCCSMMPDCPLSSIDLFFAGSSLPAPYLVALKVSCLLQEFEGA